MNLGNCPKKASRSQLLSVFRSKWKAFLGKAGFQRVPCVYAYTWVCACVHVCQGMGTCCMHVGVCTFMCVQRGGGRQWCLRSSSRMCSGIHGHRVESQSWGLSSLWASSSLFFWGSKDGASWGDMACTAISAGSCEPKA